MYKYDLFLIFDSNYFFSTVFLLMIFLLFIIIFELYLRDKRGIVSSGYKAYWTSSLLCVAHQNVKYKIWGTNGGEGKGAWQQCEQDT